MKKFTTAWRTSPKGDEMYREKKARAQEDANRTGYDYGIEANDVCQIFTSFMLPRREYRFGFETRCEVVSCTDIEKCAEGHGPVGR